MSLPAFVLYSLTESHRPFTLSTGQTALKSTVCQGWLNHPSAAADISCSQLLIRVTVAGVELINYIIPRLKSRDRGIKSVWKSVQRIALTFATHPLPSSLVFIRQLLHDTTERLVALLLKVVDKMTRTAGKHLTLVHHTTQPEARDALSKHGSTPSQRRN